MIRRRNATNAHPGDGSGGPTVRLERWQRGLFNGALMLPAGLGLTILLYGAIGACYLLPSLHEFRPGPYSWPADFESILLVVLGPSMPGLLAIGSWVNAKTRLVLDTEGVHLQFEGPVLLQRLAQTGSVRWGGIKEASWLITDVTIPGGAQLFLHRETGRPVVINPAMWCPPGQEDTLRHPLRLMRKRTMLDELERNFVVRLIQSKRPDLDVMPSEARVAKGIRGAMKATNQTNDFKRPAAVPAVGAAVLLLYAIADIYFLATEYYIGGPPYAELVSLGVLAAAAVTAVLARLEPGRKDIYVIGPAFGALLALAAYPMLTRVNAWVGDTQLQEVEYRFTAEKQWVPVNADTPALDLHLPGSDWWARFRPGDRYTFSIRRGGLGFWTVDMEPIYIEQAAWYRDSQRH